MRPHQYSGGPIMATAGEGEVVAEGRGSSLGGELLAWLASGIEPNSIITLPVDCQAQWPTNLPIIR